MNEAEWVDYDYACFQQAEDLRKVSILNKDWEHLKKNGFIWRDFQGNVYKPKTIKDKHLKNILNYCKKHYRPVEQIKALQDLLNKRMGAKK